MAEGLVSIQDELAAAARLLQTAGMNEPRREALRLWAGLAETSPGAVWQGRESAAPKGEAHRFQLAAERLARGEPMAYIVGAAGFRRLTIRCDRRALIPRPETEGLVELALRLVPGGRALDLGTGTGCIALALADEGQYRDVTGVDRSPEALALARHNAEATGLAVRWLEGHWCRPVAGEQFDLVVANPPYITEAEVDALDPGVRDWEPRMALAGGADGLRDIAEILQEVPRVLNPRGWLLMEVDSNRAGEAATLAGECGWHTARLHDDLFGRPRFLVARRENDDA